MVSSVGAHRFQDGFASPFGGQIDRACPIEVERNASFIGSNQGKNHVADIATCQVMRFKRVAVNVDTGFHCGNPIVHN